jgi:uncharacterized RDD family membrane protein YckC
MARRLACFLYEGVLLFGVVLAAGLVHGLVTQQRQALSGVVGLRIFLFLVLGVYFVGFWSRTGQTLAMQTWHLRLVTQSGQRVPRARALCRYLLAWMWFMPALITLYLSGVKGPWPTVAALIAGALAYAALIWLRPDRQYWHDAVCKTRLVTCLPPTHDTTP